MVKDIKEELEKGKRYHAASKEEKKILANKLFKEENKPTDSSSKAPPQPSVVEPSDSNITLSFPSSDDSIQFIADGQVHEYLDPSCKVNITRADFSVKLIDFEDTDYFKTLRKKMGWGKRGNQ